MNILHSINGHEDLLRLNDEERKELCAEIREFLISNVAQTGGHLASNLGAVELSVAIETVYNTKKDRLVFDVGHQSYVHKLLTGRRADFSHLRQFGGISGFPKPSESITDSFVAGHASSSVSVALGMARARTLMDQDYDVVALIGDGAATGGMAYEGLNDAAVSREPMVVILNDNEMSIGKNVGGMSLHLSRLRSSDDYLDAKRWYRKVMSKFPGGKAIHSFTKRIKDRLKRFLLPTTIFENMGFTYLGPVDGHDLPKLITLLENARELHKPVLVHVVTKKGCGYSFAEEDPAKFHGISKFDPATGKKLGSKAKTYSDIFGETLTDIARENDRVCAITAAMPGGTGLLNFQKEFPQRTFDVGIAEEHAVSMAGGLAKQGMVPVVAIYSTFLQRSFDQIMQDVALLGLHVVFAVDRAGLVGDDGPTHHGTFDVGFLGQIPGMTVLCPSNFDELDKMLRWAVNECTGPVAVRYPRGGAQYGVNSFCGDPQEVVRHCHGEDVTLISYGPIMDEAAMAARMLKGNGGESDIDAGLLQLLSPSHFSEEELAAQVRGRHVFVVEEVCSGSGISEAVAMCLQRQGLHCRVHAIDLGKNFVPHGDIRELYRLTGLDNGSIANYVREVVRNEN